MRTAAFMSSFYAPSKMWGQLPSAVLADLLVILLRESLFGSVDQQCILFKRHDVNNSEARADLRSADSRGRLSPHFQVLVVPWRFAGEGASRHMN